MKKYRLFYFDKYERPRQKSFDFKSEIKQFLEENEENMYLDIDIFLFELVASNRKVVDFYKTIE